MIIIEVIYAIVLFWGMGKLFETVFNYFWDARKSSYDYYYRSR